MMAWSNRLTELLKPFRLCLTILAVFLTISFCFGYTQDEDVGIVSYIDIEGGGLRIGECLGEEPDPRACTPNIETLHLEPFLKCSGNLSGCEEKVAYPVPFIPESSGTDIEEDIDEAWDTYVNKTIDEVSSEINKLPPCWIPTLCPPQVNWACVAERIADALVTSYTDYLPEYWTSVYESIATNAPLALHWRSALPDDGAVIAPIFSLEPKPDQYTDLVEDVRDGPYYFQGPLFPRLPVPYLPKDLNEEYGGITELEERKRELELATLLEYQQFGFVTLFQVHGEFRLEILFKLLRGPYLYTACLIPEPPFIVPLPIPVPTPVYVPRAFTDWPSVPEGYSIPRIEGKPLF